MQRLLAECVWKEHKTDAGKVYYYNSETKESVWDEPEELARVKRLAARYTRRSNMFLPAPQCRRHCPTQLFGLTQRGDRAQANRSCRHLAIACDHSTHIPHPHSRHVFCIPACCNVATTYDATRDAR